MDAVMCSHEATKQERKSAVFTAKRKAQEIERRLLVGPEHKTVNAALRRICFTLHVLGQKYIHDAPHSFDDYLHLVNCTKLLQEMGLKPISGANLKAALSAPATEMVVNSFEYRHLRNKIMASLSVIADLTEKATGSGSAEYQRGVREGYRRASDIAIMFLEDLSDGDDAWTTT